MRCGDRDGVRYRAWWALPGILLGIGLLPQALGAQSRTVDFTQVTRPVVEVTDSALIAYLLFELFLEPIEAPRRLHVIDVTQNGFGPDDVIVAYPSAEAFLIPEFIPDAVQAVMGQWAPEVEFRLDSGNLPVDALAALIGADTTRLAENAILHEVVSAVERNYRDLPVGLLFARDSLGFTFQLWDYDRTAMRYQPRPVAESDSAIATVLAALKEVGYLPGVGAARVGRALAEEGSAVASADRAMLGIASLPDGPTRQLAARTILVGAYDYDRSGTIDAAREVDAIPCETWRAVDRTFPDLLSALGVLDPAAPYAGNVVLGVGLNVREPAGRRAAACLNGSVPPPTPVAAVAPPPRATAPPAPVQAHLGLAAAAEIVRAAGATPPGSAAWAAAVRRVLLERFDLDRSGAIDGAAEVRAVPCDVWRAVVATHRDTVTDLGVGDTGDDVGRRIGVDGEARAAVTAAVRGCTASSRETVVRRRRGGAGEATRRAVSGASAAVPIAGLRSVPDQRQRELAAKTFLVAAYDRDGSGSVDSAAELDGMGCDVWHALEQAFPRFADTYGFTAALSAGSGRYRGSIVFSISDRLAEPAARRAGACLAGREPAPTSAAEVAALHQPLELPASLRSFLDLQAAARVAQAAAPLEPGSAAWAAAVRHVLLEEYDLDGSGLLDRSWEVDDVPCVVWATVRATHPALVEGLGFSGRGMYLGDRIGVEGRERSRAGSRLVSCGM